jgi:hypothetical protein
MKRSLLLLATAVGLAAPASAVGSTPTHAASTSCKAQLKASGTANFDALYKTMGGCVSKMSKLTATQRQALLTAERTCRQQQTADPTAFETKYGSTTKSGKTGSQEDAFGKCVSTATSGK